MRCLSLALMSVMLYCQAAFSTTYLVSPDGMGDFPTIQAAIDAASNGDVIELADGIFRGDGNRDIQFGKSIVLKSHSGDPGTCIIDCEGSLGEPHGGFTFQYNGSGNNGMLEGITIRNGFREFGGAIWVLQWSQPSLIRCILSHNAAVYAGGAIFTDGWPHLMSCTLYANSAPQGGAISIIDWGGAVIENTIIAFCAQGEAIRVLGGTPILTCCDIEGNAGGDWTERIANQLGVNGNICQDPLFWAPERGDLHLRQDSPCAPHSPPSEGCDLIGALPVASYPISIQDATWGRIKELYAR